MLCRPHGLLPGKRVAILTAVLFLVALAFFLSSPVISQDQEPFSGGRDGHRFGAVPPVTTAPVEPQLPEAPERIPSGPGRGVAFMYADVDGVVLSKERASLESPDGRSLLMLQRDGNLVLRLRDVDGAPNILWSTGTGDGRAATSRDVRIVPAPDGHLVLKVSATIDGKQSTLWHSDLLPDCASQTIVSNSTAASRRRLELTSAGRLSLSDACDIYVPPSEREATQSLALVISGAYRTNRTLCARALLSQARLSSVDVFAHVSYEGTADVKSKIEDELENCYGDELRAAVVRPVSELEEKYPGGEEDEKLGVCHGQVDGVSTRLKGLRDVGRMWWEWSAENGARHDTVLALRADGDSEVGVQRFRALDELHDKLIVAQSGDGDYAYCPRMTGGVGIAPSDHITYGTPATMSHYLNLYDSPSLVDMVRLAGVDGAARRGFFGCEVMPSGPRPEDCPRPVCAVECLVAWYLDSVGVGIEVEWW